MNAILMTMNVTLEEKKMENEPSINFDRLFSLYLEECLIVFEASHDFSNEERLDVYRKAFSKIIKKVIYDASIKAECAREEVVSGLAPISGKDFEGHTDHDEIIIGHWAEDGCKYDITVPPPLRESILYALNNVDQITH